MAKRRGRRRVVCAGGGGGGKPAGKEEGVGYPSFMGVVLFVVLAGVVVLMLSVLEGVKEMWLGM